MENAKNAILREELTLKPCEIMITPFSFSPHMEPLHPCGKRDGNGDDFETNENGVEEMVIMSSLPV